MDYEYLYLKLKIELMDNLDLTIEQWEKTKAFIRKEETEQLRIGGVVGQSEQLVADFTVIVGKEAHHYKDGEVIKREKLKFSN